MTGVVIDPKDLGQQEQAVQQQPTPSSGQGIVVDPSMLGAATVAPPPTAKAPSGFYQGATDPLYAVGQILAKGLEQLPEGAKLGRYPIAASAKAFTENVVPSREAEYQRQRQAAGEDGLDYGRFAGGVASSLVPGTLIAKGAGLVAPASRLAQSAITGGVSSGLMTPVESSTDFGANKAQQVLLGMGMGPLVDKTIGAVVSPAITAAGQKLKDMGIQLTPGQAFGGMTQTIEDLLAKLPITGATARSAQEKSLESFNAGVVNQSLGKIGESLPKGTTGRDAISYLYSKADDAFEQVKPKIELGNTLNLFTGLRDISKNASSLNEEQARYINNFITDKINSKISKGVISGDAFKSLDSELGKKAANYGKGVGSDAEFADALYGLRQLLRNELRTVDPTDTVSLDQLKAANSVWADKLRIERAASYLGSKDGVFTPDQLKAASKALDSTANKSATSQGKALLQSQAEAGARAGIGSIATPTQGSITAELGAGGLTGLGAAASGALPLTAALPAAPLAFYTQPMQKLFNAAMMGGRPAGAQTVRQMLPAATAPQLTGGLLRDPEGRFVVPINGVGQRQ